MMNTQENSFSRKARNHYIHSAISLLIIAVFYAAPAPEPITHTGMCVAGIFVGIIYAFSTVDIIWPALLGIVLLGTTELYSMTEVFTAAFGNDTWLFILFILTFAAIINDSGVSSIIANWMVSRKFSRGRPWVISWLLLTTAYVVAALVSVTPGIIIPWAILYTMCEHYGYQKHDKYPTLMVIGIALASLMGNTAFPFKSLSLMVQRSLLNLTGESINFWLYTVLAVCLSYAIVLTYLALCRFLFKPDVSFIEKSDYVYVGDTRMTKYQKRVLSLLAVFFVLLFAPETLPAAWPGVGFIKSIGKTATCVVLLCLSGFFAAKDTGKPVINLALEMKNGIPWPTMMLLAFAMTMTAAITNEATGIQPFLKMLFEPVFGSAPNTMVFVFLVCSVQLVLTNVFANMVIALLLVPLVCTYAPMAGTSNIMMCVSICVLVNVSLFLPSSSPFAALLHGNSEWVSSKEIYKYISVTVAFIAVVCTVICSTLGKLLFQ